MNTITNNQDTITWYEKLIKAQEQARIQRNSQQEQTSTAAVNSQSQNFNTIQSTQNTIDNKITDSLDSLVSAGTITKDQESAIQTAFQSAFQFNKSNTGTYNKVTNPLDSLVSAGTITKDQETAVKNALKPSKQPRPPKDAADDLSTALDSLVSAGTITKDQEDTIKTSIQSAFQSSKSQENSNQENQDNGLKDILDTLVSAGTITQEQEDTIQNSFQSNLELQFE